jgi:glycosyltransferase involved in cell wall biosynthesis
MRIAIYHNLLSGGAKRALMEVTRRLVPRHHVDVYTLSCSEHEFADLRPWVASHTVMPFEALRLLRSPFGRANQAIRCADLARLRRVGRQMAARIDQHGYDVAFVHPCRYEHAPSVLRDLRHTHSVYYCQEPPRLLHETMPVRGYDDPPRGGRAFIDRLDPLAPLYRRVLGRADRGNTRSADAVLVNSRFMAATVNRIYGLRASVSYLGVDPAQFKPARAERGSFVLSVGSLTPLKGFDFLVAAMARYPAATRPSLVIASNFQNAPERAYVERLARDGGVDLVLRANVTDGELVRLYNSARAVVYAPVREPFGLVPLEAMACATPVVAVAEGGVPESVVNGYTGILTERDPAHFAAAVQRLVDDPVLAGQYGENGRDHVLSRWTWERSVESLEQHLAAGAGTRARAHPPLPALAQ